MLTKSHSNRSLNVKERGFITFLGLYQVPADSPLNGTDGNGPASGQSFLNHVTGIKNAPGKLPSWYYMFNGQQFEYLEGSDYKAVVKAVFRLEGLQ